jgi:hypothetical protein
MLIPENTYLLLEELLLVNGIYFLARNGRIFDSVNIEEDIVDL